MAFLLIYPFNNHIILLQSLRKTFTKVYSYFLIIFYDVIVYIQNEGTNMTRKYTKNTGHFIPTKPTDNSNIIGYTGPARNFFLRMCSPNTDFAYRSREVHPFTTVSPEDYLEHLNYDLSAGNIGVKRMQQHLEYIFSNLSEEGYDWVIKKLFGDITEAGRDSIIAGMSRNNNVSEAIWQMQDVFEHFSDEDGELDLVRMSAEGVDLEYFEQAISESLTTIVNTLELNRTISRLWGSHKSEEYYEDSTLLLSEMNLLVEQLTQASNQHKQVQLYRYVKEQLKAMEERGLVAIRPLEFAPEPEVREVSYHD